MRARIKGLWKVLFGRTTIFVFLILIQLIVIVAGIGFLGTKVLVANNIVGVLSIIVLIYLINVRQNTSFKLMWIILIVATPIIGVPFFVYNRLQPGTRNIARRIDEQISEQRPWLLPEKDTVDRLVVDSGSEYGLFKYMYEEAHYPVYDGCGLERKGINPSFAFFGKQQSVTAEKGGYIFFSAFPQDVSCERRISEIARLAAVHQVAATVA